MGLEIDETIMYLLCTHSANFGKITDKMAFISSTLACLALSFDLRFLIVHSKILCLRCNAPPSGTWVLFNVNIYLLFPWFWSCCRCYLINLQGLNELNLIQWDHQASPRQGSSSEMFKVLRFARMWRMMIFPTISHWFVLIMFIMES